MLQVQQLWLPLNQGHAVDAKNALQLSLGVQVIQNHLTGFTTAHFDNHAQTVLIRFIAELANAFDTFFFHQLGDFLDQPGLVQLKRNLGDNDLFPALGVGFHLGATAHIDPPTPCAISLHNASPAIDDTASWKIGALNVFHQIVDGDFCIF